MSNKKSFESTDLVCLNCGYVNSIMRKKDNTKSCGHIKDLWCPWCLNVTKHFEVRDISKFMLTYNSDNVEEEKVANLVLCRRRNNG